MTVNDMVRDAKEELRLAEEYLGQLQESVASQEAKVARRKEQLQYWEAVQNLLD